MSKNKVATAYVQVMPSMDGVPPKIKQVFTGAGTDSGAAFGGNLVGKIKGLIAAAGFGKLISDSIMAGADLEQSLGGIETLFKDSADIVIKNAEQAYKSAGMSANQYMEMVTGFSASLLQGLSGDTEAAASIADMALTDMSDNANKMGTSMELIQNAYQGFAKQNYTMLDNLKLGYGGTKTEMERLLADAQKLTGVKYDISNLADVYEAIHVIQEEMGITGTTAKEAASTLSGSLASMKAAASDLMANLALGRDLEGPLTALTDTAFTFIVDNLLPAVGRALRGLPAVLSTAFSAGIRALNLSAQNADIILQQGVDLVIGIGKSIITALPYLAEAAFNVVAAIGNAIISTNWSQVAMDAMNSLRADLDLAAGEILGTDGNIVQSLLNAVLTGLPDLLACGVSLVGELASGLLSAIPFIVESAATIIDGLLSTIVSFLPDFIGNGAALIIEFATGLFSSLPAVIDSVTNILAELLITITGYLPELLAQGVSLITELAVGLLSSFPTVYESVVSILDGLLTTIVSFLPSLLASGISLIGELARGIADNLPAIITAAVNMMGELLATIASHLPDLLASGVTLIIELVAGLISAIPAISAAIPQIITSIVDTFGQWNWGEIGSNIVSGIAKGISSGASAIWQAAKNAASNALKAAKEALGIASPSRVMRDEVGKFIPSGLAVGIEANTKPLTDAMHDLTAITVGSVSPDLFIEAARPRQMPTVRSVEGPVSAYADEYSAPGTGDPSDAVVGVETIAALLSDILDAIYSIDTSDERYARAVSAVNRKMAVVRGGI